MTDSHISNLKVALIGCGAAHAHSSHLPQLQNLDQVSLEALCDLNDTCLHGAMEKYRVEKGYTDFLRMIEEVQLDAVFVIIRPSRLKDVVIPCFDKGLAVSVEKPPGVNSAETRAMLDAAERNGCPNMVGFNRRFSPVVQKALETIDGEAISSITGTFCRAYAMPIEREHAGIHGLDLMRCLGGDVAGVAVKRHVRPDGEIDAISATLEYESGALGSYHEKHYCGTNRECYEVRTDGSSLFIDYANGELRIHRAENEEETVMSDEDIAGTPDPFLVQSSFRETRSFVDCLLANEQPAPDLKDGLKTMQLNEAIYDVL